MSGRKWFTVVHDGRSKRWLVLRHTEEVVGEYDDMETAEEWATRVNEMVHGGSPDE
jgi:hypothetical protein